IRMRTLKMNGEKDWKTLRLYLSLFLPPQLSSDGQVRVEFSKFIDGLFPPREECPIKEGEVALFYIKDIRGRPTVIAVDQVIWCQSRIGLSRIFGDIEKVPHPGGRTAINFWVNASDRPFMELKIEVIRYMKSLYFRVPGMRFKKLKALDFMRHGMLKVIRRGIEFDGASYIFARRENPREIFFCGLERMLGPSQGETITQELSAGSFRQGDVLMLSFPKIENFRFDKFVRGGA